MKYAAFLPSSVSAKRVITAMAASNSPRRSSSAAWKCRTRVSVLVSSNLPTPTKSPPSSVSEANKHVSAALRVGWAASAVRISSSLSAAVITREARLMASASSLVCLAIRTSLSTCGTASAALVAASADCASAARNRESPENLSARAIRVSNATPLSPSAEMLPALRSSTSTSSPAVAFFKSSTASALRSVRPYCAASASSANGPAPAALPSAVSSASPGSLSWYCNISPAMRMPLPSSLPSSSWALFKAASTSSGLPWRNRSAATCRGSPESPGESSINFSNSAAASS